MINKEHQLPVTKQCHILDMPAPVSDNDAELMRLIDETHLEQPYLGSRGMKCELRSRGYNVGRIHIRTLMRKMDIEALYKKPRLSKPHPDHKIYPYLLRGLDITEANADWASRKVLSWRVSNTLDVSFCIEALEEAIAHYGTPGIFNTDQGSQFTSLEFTNILINRNIRISMDGQGRWRDNVFIERLWKTVKYEEVYLKAYESITHAKKELRKFFDRYNIWRQHQGLGERTPDDVYWSMLPNMKDAV